MALSYRETYMWHSNVELWTAKIKCRLESEKEVEFRIVKLQCRISDWEDKM